MQHARLALDADACVDRRSCEELSELTLHFDHLVILRGGAPGAPNLMTEAIALLERCDPQAHLRAIKLAYIDRLVSSCDSLMRAGEMPDAYLHALGEAVGEFEAMFARGADADFLAFVWDILAQAEAGLGEATSEAHYEQAQQRYRRARRGAAPVLALVSAV